MGNTNLPQFGAADTRNSRDTLTGDEQLTDQQKEQRQKRKGDADAGPSPSRPKNAPARIPGQSRETDKNEDREAADPSAYEGHANTGHSPSGAT